MKKIALAIITLVIVGVGVFQPFAPGIARADSVIFTNSNSLYIPDAGNANPYPSTINVSGLSGTIVDVNVSLYRLDHTYPDDVDVLLVSPTGTSVMLMSDVGGSETVFNQTFTLDDGAASGLSDESLLVSGTYQPTNIDDGEDGFVAPAPGQPYGANLADFNGTDPNGIWSLYIMDDASGDLGRLAGGWNLRIITTTVAPTLTIDDVTVPEGPGGTTNLNFTVTRTGDTSGTATVDYAVAAGTAQAGSDYTPVSGTLTFAPTVTVQTITVPILGDTTFEPNETFLLNLSNPTNAVLTHTQAVGTIADDDSRYVIIYDNGSSDPYPVTFEVTGMTGVTTDVDVILDGLYHTFPDDMDMLLVSPTGTAVIILSDVGGSAEVNGVSLYLDDAAADPLPDEDLLSSGSYQPTDVDEGGDYFDGPAPAGPYSTSLSAFNGSDPNGIWSLYIMDDAEADIGYLEWDWSLVIATDGPADFAIDDVSLAEGDSGTTNATFTVTRTGNTSISHTIDYATTNGTATAGTDYTAASGTLTFAAGVTTRTITVPVTGEIRYEADETFFVNLSNASASATITDSQGSGTITNDDVPASFTLNDVSVTEGNTGTTNLAFTVTRSGDTTGTTTVMYATTAGSATAGTDYTTTSGTLTFAPSVMAQTITVPITGEISYEADETFFVNLSNASAPAIITDNQGIGTISNDDVPAALSINDVTMTEGNSGTANLTFTVTRTGDTTGTTTVDYATANDTATAGSDYTATSGTLTFTAGVTTQTITVPITGEISYEADETFFVNLSNPGTPATLSDSQGIGTITNDDVPAALSINDVSVTEGNSGTTNLVFTVTRAGDTTGVTTVDYATANGTATAGTDYTTTAGTLTFAANATTRTITVPVIGEFSYEADETFFLNLSNASSPAIISDNQGVGTITNDDVPASLSIIDVSVTEGNAGTTNLVFTVTRTGDTTGVTTVDYATADNTATAGSDYTTTTGTLTFAANATTRTITVLVSGEISFEADETFFLNLSNASIPAIISDNQGIGTISNDDVPAALSINDVTMTEGNSGTSNLNFTVIRTGDTTGTTTVDYATANNTATAGSDYTTTAGTLTFTAGVISQTISVPIIGEISFEADETFFLNLSNASAPAIINDNQGLGTITNNDVPADLSINDVSVTEGNAGTTNLVFTVTRSGDTTGTTTVDYSSANGSAASGSDYSAASGTLTFTANVTTQTITVPVVGEISYEADETFFLNLSNASSPAVISDSQGIGTIINDDVPADLSIDDVSVTEGNAGTTNLVFTVTRTGDTTGVTTVDYSTADGTATSGSDYTAIAGTLTFTANVTTQTITVPVSGDTLIEADETLVVNLSNASTPATVSDSQGLGTIADDDASFSIDDLSLNEGNSGTSIFTFTVTRTGHLNSLMTVDFATLDDSAASASDYGAVSGTLTFGVGVVTQTVDVMVVGDPTLEHDETFFVLLSNPTGGATISDHQGTAMIVNDDSAPGFSIADVSLAEGNSGSTAFVFTVTKSGSSSFTHTLDFSTADSTALAGNDYAATSGTLSFDPGTNSLTVTVAVTGEIIFEGDEAFTLDLSNPGNGATLVDGQASGTILNDDAPAGLAITDVSVTEGDAGSTNLIFTVTRGGDTSGTTTVDYTSTDGTATAGSDYTAASSTLTFNPNEVSQTITVAITGDTLAEADETFSMTLANASAPAVISTGVATGTILNDELPPGFSVADVTVSERAGSGAFTITLNPANSVDVSVDYLITDGTAKAGRHYTAVLSGTLNFPAGTTSQTVPFTIIDNTVVEPSRSFSITLSNSSGPDLVRATARAIITEQDVAVVTIPEPPPATACADVNFEDPGIIRAVFENDADRAGLHCRLLASSGDYLYWYGSPLTTSGNIGNQTVLDLGVVAAVDVAGPGGFQAGVAICLKGAGYMIYLDASEAPRVPRLWSTWTTPSFPGYTCTTLYAPGTVVLVTNRPQ